VTLLMLIAAFRWDEKKPTEAGCVLRFVTGPGWAARITAVQR